MTERSGVVRQRATLVLPSSGAFDSRAWRIASSLAARARTAAIERWNWETESAKLVALYGRLAGA